jgi:hypothetical protein
MKIALYIAAVLVFILFSAWATLMLFVIPPIGIVPEGKILVLRRIEKMKFIESPESICEREQGFVNIMCRAGVLGRFSTATILLRLPYVERVYLYSTGGKTYSDPK